MTIIQICVPHRVRSTRKRIRIQKKIILFSMLAVCRVLFKLNGPGSLLARVHSFHPCCFLRSIKTTHHRRFACACVSSVSCVCVCVLAAALHPMSHTNARKSSSYIYSCSFCYGKLFKLVVLRYCAVDMKDCTESQSYSIAQHSICRSRWTRMENRLHAHNAMMCRSVGGRWWLIASIATRQHYTCMSCSYNVFNVILCNNSGGAAIVESKQPRLIFS